MRKLWCCVPHTLTRRYTFLKVSIFILMEYILFTLNSFTVLHKGNTLYDCQFNDEPNNKRGEIFTSLIIGENGVGKSFLLKIISDFFRFVSRPTKSTQIKYERISASYNISDKLYEITKEKNNLSFKLNGNIVSRDEIEIPQKIIALSFMVNDKFSFVSDRESSLHEEVVEEKYKYLGVRATSNATYTSTIQKKLLSSILKILDDPKRVDSLNKVFDFVGLDSSIEIVYKLKRKTLFSRGVDNEFVKKKMNSVVRRKEFLRREILDGFEFTSEQLVEFIERLSHSNNVHNDYISFSLNTAKSSNSDFFEYNNYLKMMESLELIASPDIKFVKSDYFDFEHTSSGEKHFIFTMINLLSEIEDNSLIMIDEPELSLHPRWQMNYINLLKSVTTFFKSSHCLLASHSHFMVSDLNPESSSLLSLGKFYTNGVESRISKLIQYDTYAWSAENILYEVFNLRTTRNKYFESDIVSLLKLISESSHELEEVTRLHEKLSNYILNDNDPVNEILSQSKKYIESMANDK